MRFLDAGVQAGYTFAPFFKPVLPIFPLLILIGAFMSPFLILIVQSFCKIPWHFSPKGRFLLKVISTLQWNIIFFSVIPDFPLTKLHICSELHSVHGINSCFFRINLLKTFQYWPANPVSTLTLFFNWKFLKIIHLLVILFTF